MPRPLMRPLTPWLALAVLPFSSRWGKGLGIGALLLLTACAPEGELGDAAPQGPPFRFNITALPAEYQPWFAEAAEDWNEATGKTMIVVDPDGEHRAVMDDLGDGPEWAYTACDGGRCVIAFRETLKWTQCGPSIVDGPAYGVQDVARHELCHVARCRFRDNPDDPIHSLSVLDTMHSIPPMGCRELTARDIASMPW